MEQYFNIGKLAATFGLKGELILQHSLGHRTPFKGLEVIFVEHRKDSFLPYFVQEVRVKGDTDVYIQLEGIETKEQARLLTQKDVWLKQEDFAQYAGKSAPISLLGFHLINEGDDLGEIIEVIEQPMQVLCKIMLNDNEALIPLHEETLDKIDQKNKEVHVTLPDGLLEIYGG